MLGRLIGNAASSLSSVNYPRDSIVDEEYTRGLLFPDYATSQDAPTHVPQVGPGRVGDFDNWNGLELDASKDFRVIVAQDALGDSEEPCILFDTHPIQQCESPAELGQRGVGLQTHRHRRGGSTTLNLKSPTSPLFSKPQQRITSNNPNIPFPMRNRSSTFSGASDEHDPRLIRSTDSKEETKTILSCAFGSSSGASSGSKMHVLPLGSGGKELPVTPSSPVAGSSMSAGYFRKRDPIARAHTSVLSGSKPFMHDRSHSYSGPKSRFTDAVLITKLFSVNMPEPTDLQTLQSSHPGQEGGPVSDPAERTLPHPPLKGKKPRAKKTPVFAIILVIQLPNNSTVLSRPPSRAGLQSPQSYTSVRSFRSSFNLQSGSPKSEPYATPISRGDARVNALVEHWDVIDRTLTLLETVSAPTILGQLKQVDSFSAAVVSKPSKPKEKTMQRTNQINIYLSPLALGSVSTLKDAAIQAVQRIRRALRIPRVTTGQGRWGLWNDELIRTARCYGGTEQKFFILNLLTSFLGAHTAEWMTLLAPSWYRRRRSIPRKTNDPDMIITRTIVVSHDRSIARRLIFLLSSFLPGVVHSENGGAFYKGPGSSISLRNAILHSPRPEPSTSTHRNRYPEGHQSQSLSSPTGGLLISQGLQRKSSDIHSARSIPIPANDLSLRKSSAATTSTVTPNLTTPVPQFASSSDPEVDYLPDESSASASLSKIWQNANRDSDSSTASTKWGSLLSGFWSKDSSASASESTAPSASSSIGFKKGTLLDDMVKELSIGGDTAISASADELTQSIESLPSRTLPIKLQVNADEGVIDVDIGIPGFLSSSNESSFPSPPFRNIRHVSSIASFDSLASSKGHFPPRGGSRLQSRVAGFLPRFHPDYSLQAVRASKAELPDMIEKIRSAMLSEPYSQEATTSGWVDVSTTLIANVQTASVKRLCLKRKVSRLGDHTGDNTGPVIPSMEQSTAPRLIEPSSTASSEFFQEQAFSYESVADSDPSLIDVVERILARDRTHNSRSISPAPFSHSRQTSTGTNRSHRRGNPQSTLSGSRSPDGSSRGLCENLIIGALEDVVKSVNRDLAQARNGSNGENNVDHQSMSQTKDNYNNALRDGVRRWLLDVEHTTVW